MDLARLFIALPSALQLYYCILYGVGARARSRLQGFYFTALLTRVVLWNGKSKMKCHEALPEGVIGVPPRWGVCVCVRVTLPVVCCM
jgi:hypothetical protein